ncbi:hypothetical protein MJA45_12640 [Paenibacillus aurantius]|uniref:Uncharacterized protein n=1 Tax=Paenibacillus aurantius TaxID=2918900 RepID=A0AA96LKN0_9BACL|nr:hypothetical protein [Paenibacillus aurantius]WJH33327.1 hypothetical protein N6H14_25065 [Paenibacillus sp. CC-CFT747]WNQ13820.1 hypothetical protein MJA45_12640 [Paenibacillus aurantius]
MKNEPLHLLEKAQTEEDLLVFQEIVTRGGYSGFHALLEGFKLKIKTFMDEEADSLLTLVATARRLLPDPGSVSPSWQVVWDELEKEVEAKREVLKRIPPYERDGEWQIIIDNPHAVKEVVCYPGLVFPDAAYLYAYFSHQLENNEYIRLQKIVNVLVNYGQDAGQAE